MNTKLRFVFLVRFFIDSPELCDIDWYDQAQLLDCAMACPALLLPARRSLRYFVRDFVWYFMGWDEELARGRPKVARFVDRWRKNWLVPPKTKAAGRGLKKH